MRRSVCSVKLHRSCCACRTSLLCGLRGLKGVIKHLTLIVNASYVPWESTKVFFPPVILDRYCALSPCPEKRPCLHVFLTRRLHKCKASSVRIVALFFVSRGTKRLFRVRTNVGMSPAVRGCHQLQESWRRSRDSVLQQRDPGRIVTAF